MPRARNRPGFVPMKVTDIAPHAKHVREMKEKEAAKRDILENPAVSERKKKEVKKVREIPPLPTEGVNKGAPLKDVKKEREERRAKIAETKPVVNVPKRKRRFT